MRRWWILLLVAALLMPGISLASENDAYLSGDDLQVLSPAFETFLEALADVLVDRGLLSENDREAWVLYQRGDFLQNGGFGLIAIMYTPGLLSVADESVTLRRLSATTDVGTVWLETLHRYSTSNSPLPGLPLDMELLDDTGTAVPCRFRWIASGGSFLIWDGSQGTVVNVGAFYVSDGRPLYWKAEPAEGIDETLTLELLHPTEDRILGVVTLSLLAGQDFWSPEVFR